MEQQHEKYSHIKGWGVDADLTNNPTYPIKKNQQNQLPITRPTLQISEKEILHSNERPYMTAVFGTTAPPSGLSGRIRRYAFRYSESNLMHWLSLLLADRINVVEGIFQDISSGHIPNIPLEKGWKAQWKYNRKRMAKRMAVGAGVVLLGLLITGLRNVHRRSQRQAIVANNSL